MRTNRLHWFGWILAILFLLLTSPALAQHALNTSPAGTGSDCALKPGKTCYHYFNQTHTATTGDSLPYQVNMCSVLTFYFAGDITATLQVKENNVASTTGATAVEYDWDGDGIYTAVDTSSVLDGTPGLRSFSVRPKAPFEYVDVIKVPSSGTVALAITCQ